MRPTWVRPQHGASSGAAFLRRLDQAFCRDAEPFVQAPDHLERERTFVVEEFDRMRAELAQAFAGTTEKAVEALVGEAVKDLRTRRRKK